MTMYPYFGCRKFLNHPCGVVVLLHVRYRTCVTCINHSGPPNPPRYCAQTVRKGAQEPIQMSQRSMQYPTALRALFDALGEMNRRVFALVPNLNKPTDAR